MLWIRADRTSVRQPVLDSHENRAGRPPRPHCFTLWPWNRPKLSSPTNFSSSGPVAFTSSAPVRHSTEPRTQKGSPVATAAIRAHESPTSPAQENRTCFCRFGMLGPSGPGSGPARVRTGTGLLVLDRPGSDDSSSGAAPVSPWQREVQLHPAGLGGSDP